MENNTTAQPSNLRPKHVGPILGVETSTVWSYLRQGILPHVKLNGRYFIRREALMQWLAEQERGGTV
jgi:excisionase family DNA binding protein